MHLQRGPILVLAATCASALAQLPLSALSQASEAQSQLLSLAGITSLPPAAASAEAAAVTSVASDYASRPEDFSVDEINYSALATDAAARSTYIAYIESQNPAVFGASAVTVTGTSTGASTMSTSLPSRTSATSTAPTTTQSKGAAPTRQAFSGAFAVFGLVSAALL